MAQIHNIPYITVISCIDTRDTSLLKKTDYKDE